jgi:hypothetical protein
MSQYDDLVRDPEEGRRILARLYPHIAARDCPATADAVDDYLNTGQEVQVPLSVGTGRYALTANWRRLQRQALINYVRSLGPNHHVVVRGTRRAAFRRRHHVSANHFFVLANIGGQVYVIDAMMRSITTNVSQYLNDQGLTTLDYTSLYEAVEIM